jgi:hypothetical protein
MPQSRSDGRRDDGSSGGYIVGSMVGCDGGNDRQLDGRVCATEELVYTVGEGIGMAMEMGQRTLGGVTPVEVEDEDLMYRRMCPMLAGDTTLNVGTSCQCRGWMTIPDKNRRQGKAIHLVLECFVWLESKCPQRPSCDECKTSW